MITFIHYLFPVITGRTDADKATEAERNFLILKNLRNFYFDENFNAKKYYNRKNNFLISSERK